jgi:putative NAD(P)-binding protein
VLCSAIGASDFARHRQPLRDFLAAKHAAERRLADLDVPSTILRFGGLTDGPPTGRIRTMVDGDGAQSGLDDRRGVLRGGGCAAPRIRRAERRCGYTSTLSGRCAI